MQFKDVNYLPDNHSWNITMTGNGWPWMLKVAKPTIRCPNCKSTNVYVHSNYIKGGKRYECINDNCETITFIVK